MGSELPDRIADFAWKGRVMSLETEETDLATDIGGDPLHWPPEARLILSALEAGEALTSDNRRSSPRTLYQVQASLRLFSDPDGAPPWKLYTRDVSRRSLGVLAA